MSVSPDDMSFLDRLGVLTSGIDKKLQPFGGATNLGLSLLANSGYSTTPRSFGQVLGASALQSQQLAAQRQNDQLEQSYKRAQIQRLMKEPTGPATVQEYEYAVRNGFTGTFEDWQTKARGQNDPADVAVYKYWNSLSPDERQNFLKLKRNVGSDFAIETVNGVPTVVYKPAAGGNSMIPLVTPLTNLPAQAAGASTIKQAEATGSKTGEALGGIAGGIQTKGANAVSTNNLLDIAEPLIDVATGSATGAARDAVARVFGSSTSGATAISKLKVLQAGLMTSMPRMEGPQSDRDVMLYREAAGQIGDPIVPAEQKKAAVETIRQIQDRYIERAGGSPTKTQAPKAAIDYLKSHPEAADQFKAKYGYLP
jgi:hypothetical protein